MHEVRRHNIRVISVCSSSDESDMVVGSPFHKDIKQMLKPEDISDIIYSAIKLPDRALVSELDIRPNNP
jgi:3-oxoacyl-[acyl-carrier protein] reductase